MRTFWLSVALAPYLTLAAVDAWMHERARRVPPLEQWIHGGLAVSIILFFTLVFASRTLFAMGVLACFILLLTIDELRFHRGIAAEERRIHIASWIALAGFVFVWYLVDN